MEGYALKTTIGLEIDFNTQDGQGKRQHKFEKERHRCLLNA